ncbi:MAG: ABC transporter substrate-binding protein [Spirochaetaceae bacterium]|nr:ABC transporter substrate-binding protein [Spirochaetaceae bacterium]
MIDRRLLAAAIGLALAPWAALAAGGTEETTAAAEADTAAAAGPMAEIEGLVPDMVNFFTTVTEYEQATGNRIASFQEAPMLAALVKAGELPPLEERMPPDPMVIVPLESVGTYGGSLRHGALSPVTAGAESWTARTQPLLMVHPSLQAIAPNAATGWDWNDDFSQLTVHLRPGLRWSDGDPLTADDFTFWYEDFLGNEQLVASRPASWRLLDSLERVDDHTVRLTFSRAYPSVLNILGTEARRYHEVPFLPAHFLAQFHVDHNPDAADLAKAEGHESWAQLFLSKWPVDVQQRMDPAIPTIDPWTMVEVDELGNKFFSRNPYYWKVDTAGNQLPYIDTQDRLLHENLEAVTSKIIAGELDYALQFTTMDNFPLYKEHEERGNYRTNLWYDGRGNVMLAIRPNFNHRDPVMRELFQELRFREALSVSLDRDEINEVIWRGLATPRAATVDPTVSFYEPWMGSNFIEYDVERANAILDELGLAWDDRQEFRLRPDGDTLSIHIDYYQLEEKMEVGVELIKQFWEEIGIKVGTRAVDGPLFGQRRRAGELDVFIWNFDQTTEIGFHGRPTFAMPPLDNAVDWNAWVESGGEQGEQPPAEVTRWMELAEEFQQYPMGHPRYMEIGTELLTVASNSLWDIGIAGITPKPMTVKANLRNVKGDGGLFIYSYRFWMIYHPEQWYYEQ